MRAPPPISPAHGSAARPTQSRGWLSRLAREEDGAVAGIYGLSLFALVAGAGVAWDWTRVTGMHSELQNAADQAALAAATQLDGDPGTCSRASATAVNLLANSTLLSNDGGSTAITITNEAACDATGLIRFWQDEDRATAATSDANANFVEVSVDGREAIYAFTPVVGALRSGDIQATAMAGLGSAICKVPPIMLCHPDPTLTVDWDSPAWVGRGVAATGHNAGNSANQGGGSGSDGAGTTWSPGNFGFLQVEDFSDNSNRNAALLKALAQDEPAIDCVPIGDNKVSTGNPQGLYDAVNTRFGIYDFPSTGGGNVLASCLGGDCTAAPNTRMDMTHNAGGGGNNACKINRSAGVGGQGYTMPTSPFDPVYVAGASATTRWDKDTNVSTMGLPRDNCHYTTFDEGGGASGDGICPDGRFGDGEWSRADYWAVHPNSASKPSDWASLTRYETYLEEIALGIADAPKCGVTGEAIRRVLTVAIVTNCSELSGTSQPVDIDEFVDVFLVEPSTDNAARYNAYKDVIYLEIIGKSKIAGNGTFGPQSVRRDVPYLVR